MKCASMMPQAMPDMTMTALAHKVMCFRPFLVLHRYFCVGIEVIDDGDTVVPVPDLSSTICEDHWVKNSVLGNLFMAADVEGSITLGFGQLKVPEFVWGLSRRLGDSLLRDHANSMKFPSGDEHPQLLRVYMIRSRHTSIVP